MRIGRVCLAAIALAALPLPASATIIKAYDFQAATAGPTASHAGSFAFSYDEISGESALIAIDFAIGMTPFSLFNASVAPHAFHSTRPQFILGGVRPRQPANAIEHNTDDFWLIFRADTDTASHFAYSQVGADYYASEALMLAAAPAVVPEPAAWPLFVLALAMLAMAVRGLRPRAAARG